MTPKPYWRDMPTTAFGPQARDWIAVLPLAAIEQHGPHLPVGVDAHIADGMVRACVAALTPDLATTFLPVQEVAKSDEHTAFPGTLTLGWKTATDQWIEIGHAIARAGPRSLVMVTSHGGNAAAMDIAARQLRVDLGLRVVTTSWGRLGQWQQVYPYPDGPITDIHGGLSETSLMLALRPDLVDMAQAADFASDQTRLADRSRLGWHGGRANMAWAAQDLNPAGVVGDAAAATAELGQRDIDLTVQGFVTLIRELRTEIEDKGHLA